MTGQHIEAPFTEAEVLALNWFQHHGRFHPFTCHNRGDGKHRDHEIDRGLLVATAAGWVCEDCDYTQTWAHTFMAAPPPATVPGHERRARP